MQGESIVVWRQLDDLALRAYFHSQGTLEIKLGLVVSRRHGNRWKKPARNTRSALSELQSMFQARFEKEL